MTLSDLAPGLGVSLQVRDAAGCTGITAAAAAAKVIRSAGRTTCTSCMHLRLTAADWSGRSACPMQATCSSHRAFYPYLVCLHCCWFASRQLDSNPERSENLNNQLATSATVYWGGREAKNRHRRSLCWWPLREGLIVPES